MMERNTGPIRVAVVYGTRPEVVKMAPVIGALRRRPERFITRVWTTAQHRELVDQAQRVFGLEPDVDLDLMRPSQELNQLASRAFAALDRALAEERPDWLLVQGDTTTAMAAALSAFHRGVRVGHVEAGLRSGDLQHPFPEEANRRLIDVVAAALFAPTARAEGALLAEGREASRVFRVGNTVVDALLSLAPVLSDRSDRGEGPEWPDGDPEPEAAEVLVTLHRRESFGAPLAGLFAAVAELARRYPELRWTVPVHPNPTVEVSARAALGGLPNVDLCAPLPYDELLRRLRRVRLVLTDSGGLQEEAPAFGTPVLVLRRATERPEGIEAGIARLVGTDPARVVEEAARLLDHEPERRRLRALGRAANPYGDGRAAERIASILAGEPWLAFTPPHGASVEREEATFG